MLGAVAAGRVVRGASGHDGSFNAPCLLEGEPVQLVLRWLAGEDGGK